MPNYGLVINSEYKPMSFEQYAAPFEKYAQVYNQMADTYDAMEIEAGQWEKLAHSTKDAAQYAQYKKYADDLRAAASDLADNGLSTRTRGSVSNLRKRYSNEIVPISEAWDYRNKMIEEQRRLNPTGDLQFDIDFSDIGLGEIIQNPTLSYAPGRSLSEMEKAGHDIAVAASARAKSKKSKDKGLGNNYYKITQGYTEEDVKGFLAELESGTFDKYKDLGELYNQLRTTYGTNNENSPYTSDQNIIADKRILTGFLKGLTKQDSYQSVPRTPVVPKQYVGYEKTIKDSNGNSVTYTSINVGGNFKYYDENGTLVTDANTIAKLDAQKNAPRYYLDVQDNSGLYVVKDARTNTPLTNADGKFIKFDPRTHYWDSVYKKIKPLTNAGNSTRDPTIVPKIPMTSFLVGNSTGGSTAFNITDKNGKVITNTKLSKKKMEKLIEKATPLNFDQLDASYIPYIHEDIRAAADNYLFYVVEADADGTFTGDNTFVIAVPTTQIKIK